MKWFRVMRIHGQTAWRAIAETAKVSPTLFIFWMILTVASAATPAAQVWVVRALMGSLADSDGSGRVGWLVAAAVGVLWVTAVCGDGAQATASVLSRRVVGEATSQVIEAVARRTPQEVARAETASAAKAARDAVSESLAWHPRSVVQACQGLLSLVMLLVALWPLSPIASLLLVSALVTGLPLLSRIGVLEAEAFPARAEQERYAEYYADQLMSQRSATELVSLGTGSRLAGMTRSRLMAGWHVYRNMMLATIRLNVLASTITVALAGSALWIVAHNSNAGAGGVAAGVVAVLSGTSASLAMALAIGTVLTGTWPVRDMYAFIDEAPSNVITQVPRKSVDRLCAQDLGFTYPGSPKSALCDASLTVMRGQMIAIVGPNGAGKTTLASCLAGLLDPSTGAVYLDGIDLAGMSMGERLGATAIMTQEFGRYELTVRDAVLLGSPREDVSDREVWEALRVARLDEVVVRMGGLDTQLGQQWGGVGLSGGQWQRLALARVALRNSPVWILDEPTSAVDAETEAELFADLGRTRGSRITIVVSHRVWTLRDMDMIYVLDSGRIVEKGTYSQLMMAQGRFAHMFQFQRDEQEPIGPAEGGHDEGL